MAPIRVEMEPSDQIGMPEQSFLAFDPAVEQERSRAPYFAQTPLELKFQKEWLSHFELEKEARDDMERALAQERTNLKNSQQRRATEELVKKHDEPTMEVLDTIGIPEKSFLDSDPIVQKERSIEPYFASTPSQLRFEREWKQHFQSEKEAKQNFDRLIAEERASTVKSQMRQVTEDSIRRHDATVLSLKKKLEEYDS